MPIGKERFGNLSTVSDCKASSYSSAQVCAAVSGLEPQQWYCIWKFEGWSGKLTQLSVGFGLRNK